MSALIHNKKATFDYELLETFEAGIELLGVEVKSIKSHHGKLESGHVIVRGGEAFLVGVHIPPYQASNTPESYDPDRTRRLLLTKKEIKELATADSQKGLTIVPIKMYNKGRKLKIELAIGRGKKRADKRETLKKRDTDRDIQIKLKQRR